ncbi:aminotransferase class I/II-fold pyridoxal phosphate-dependent enzyme [Cryobacterium sp. PH31-O1]|uniref:MalY/PatB family protein n=1 Tax=Cryobacterium sp. PH31-O1 TaxID=3046306 RepID=UPI0024B88AF9|nr:aminotransferase class I/II-fold pyridoxal phosphate-dependent enzyme [Cryobacterium sp. PH31-O1]MDJ0338981.1 aminotransferase class I/II-fold pyridoxal phosphate-dependent enzyme [Cryobacterium sp. PH31-O1]
MSVIEVAPLDHIRRERSSIKWTRFPADVLPLFVAEMDYPLAPAIVATLVERVQASDTGYLDGPGPLAPAFAEFALSRWGWTVDPSHVHLATDVSVGIVEALRLAVPAGGRVAITPPVYPPFYELVEEAAASVIETPLLEQGDSWVLDLAALETSFASGIDAFLLCNPHNPHGIVWHRSTLEALARLAAQYDVFVISDEIHAPLTYPGVAFTPFAPLALTAGARAVTVTSASKGWNVAGLKCALVIAVDDATNALLNTLPEEVACRTSILGLHANIAAFGCTDWLDNAIDQIVANDLLLSELLREHLPAVIYHRPRASYLAWLDLRHLGLGESPYQRILDDARVALNNGECFGLGGHGFARLNLACSPHTLREAVARIAALVARVATEKSAPPLVAPAA